MYTTGSVPVHVASLKWQDYRGLGTGTVVYYNSDSVSELPIREIPEEIPSDIVAEPNYETGSYGVYGCTQTKMRNAFAKKKQGYLFFMTRYSGTNPEFLDDLMVTGFYHVSHIADSQKLHIRYLNEYSCISDKQCTAMRADEIHFVSVEDAYMVSPEKLEEWGASTRVTRQTKIALEEEQVQELLEYLRSKENKISEYKEITEDLMPDEDEEEDDEEDED